MISEKARLIIEQEKAKFIPIADWKHTDYPLIRQIFNAIPSEPVAEGTSWETKIVNGVLTEFIHIKESSGKIIMHVHGGGMVFGTASSDRFMLSHIGTLTGRNTISVEYRLCPEFTQPAALEDCAAVYQGLLAEGYHAKDISLLGESAGGMLVLSLCAYLKKHGIAMPGAICAISGSVDSQYASQSMETNKDKEIAVCLNLKEIMNELYYKGTDPHDPIFSPIYSDLHGWPPTYLFACENEILRDESVRMCVKLQEAGVLCELSLVEDLFHTYMLRDMPESYEAFRRIADFFKRH